MGNVLSKSDKHTSDRKKSYITGLAMVFNAFTAIIWSAISQTVQSSTGHNLEEIIQSSDTPFTFEELPDESVLRRRRWSQISTATTSRHDSVYDLSKKAYVLVLHHYEFQDSRRNRHGSSKDMEKIEEIFRNYRCDELDINENFTANDVKRKMKEISKKDFSQYSCLFVFFMSHGDEGDLIEAYDGKMYSLEDDIKDYCTANRTLDDKPKIFVVQACRGNAIVRVYAQGGFGSVPNKYDHVVFQSSYQGAVSYRHTDDGSFFMQAFLRLLHANNQQNIIDVNEALNREFKEKNILQTPTLTTTLQKKFIFGELLRQ